MERSCGVGNQRARLNEPCGVGNQRRGRPDTNLPHCRVAWCFGAILEAHWGRGGALASVWVLLRSFAFPRELLLRPSRGPSGFQKSLAGTCAKPQEPRGEPQEICEFGVGAPQYSITQDWGRRPPRDLRTLQLAPRGTVADRPHHCHLPYPFWFRLDTQANGAPSREKSAGISTAWGTSARSSRCSGSRPPPAWPPRTAA